ncbi:hypothetical protein [Corynebacterium dentalis]|uniref:hypothetical protein n=1 Tax=Corynebacterium dentalis TaxID=2014528 RepID=UPI000C07682B|nr:hypothetical protein [Corynebacterium dentalis]
MSVFDNESFPQEIVAGIAALLKKNPQDYFALVGLNDLIDSAIQIPVLAGFSWVEQAEENLNTAGENLLGILNEIAHTSTKKLAVVTISDNNELQPIAELAEFIAGLMGMEIIANLRVPTIEAGAPITGSVHGHAVSMTQIDPTESQAHQKSDPWAPPADSEEFENMLRDFFNEG